MFLALPHLPYTPPFFPSLPPSLVLSKFKAPLGGELNSSYVGGSAMPVEVANFFENVGR